MNQLVVLSLGNGDLNNGFPAVTAELWEANNPYPMKFTGSLPAAPELPELYRAWQLLYSALYSRRGWNTRLEIEEADVTNVSEVDFNDLCQRLSERINAWLHSESFRNIDQQLRTRLNFSDEIRFIIETNDKQLRRLPWHLWNFLEHYSKAEVALSTPEYQRVEKLSVKTPRTKVAILAILGNSKGIDVAQDRAFLEELSEQAEIEFLEEPKPKTLHEKLWQEWDILFFAGHSSSREKGVIQLNQIDSLTLDQLRFALKKAIARGLKLAIFNSCDGLGLAQELADMHIPQVIVMREPVPDAIAHEFLKHFLVAFSGGQSLYASVREARERLQRLESQFPCATWLPTICQNPAEVPTTWQEWCLAKEHNSATSTTERQHRQLLPSRKRFSKLLLASAAVTTLVMGGRWLGLLQPVELQAYDQLLRLRSDEAQDQRLLIVTITESDFQLQEQQQRKGSLSDRALARLLEKLEPYQPRAIGLDIYRDFPADSNQGNLTSRLKKSDRFFAICKVSTPKLNNPGIAPPPEIPIERQGFSDFVQDSDGVLRRHLLAMNPDATSPCTTPYALSAQLAFRYLRDEGIVAQYTPQQELQIGNVIFKRLRSRMGGYQRMDDWGYQILLNYRRSYHSPLEVAEKVTLQDVLAGKVQPDKVKDRIILIGVTAESAGDRFATPYSTGQGTYEAMPGVIVHAQMVSQILSAVKDGRVLMWVWAWWGDILWVWSWSVVGGVVVWRFGSIRWLGLASGVTFGLLYGFSFGFLTQGVWVPLVPAAIASIATGGIMLAQTSPRTEVF
jgi:CHASE2 domain-containing sensor protein